MPAADIREQVKDFKERYAHGDDIGECFAPWYLAKTYGVSPTEAIRCSAESTQAPNGSGLNRGADAFHLLREEGKPAQTNAYHWSSLLNCKSAPPGLRKSDKSKSTSSAAKSKSLG